VIFNGFGKIVQGVLERRYSVPVRVFLISPGILSLGVAILVGHAEQFGTIFLTGIISLVLILYGMQMIFFRNYGEVSIAKNFEKIVCS
jgi:phosphate starvation-inducible membrane PsiE